MFMEGGVGVDGVVKAEGVLKRGGVVAFLSALGSACNADCLPYTQPLFAPRTEPGGTRVSLSGCKRDSDPPPVCSAL